MLHHVIWRNVFVLFFVFVLKNLPAKHAMLRPMTWVLERRYNVTARGPTSLSRSEFTMLCTLHGLHVTAQFLSCCYRDFPLLSHMV